MSQKSQKVLVVDDEPDIREILMHFVSEEGFEVDEAENGQVALEMALKNDYYFVLTDLDMPKMNGTQLIAALRRVKPLLPVGIVSAKVTEFATELVSVAVTATIPKPFTAQTLRTAMASLSSVAEEMSDVAEPPPNPTTVRDLIKGEPITVAKDVPVTEAIRIMAERKIGAILVMEGDKIEGIFTERDLLMNSARIGAEIFTQQVGEHMTRMVRTVTDDAKVEEVEDLMDKYGIRHIPVVNGDKSLAGVVSMRDISQEHLGSLKRSLASKEEALGHIKNQTLKM